MKLNNRYVIGTNVMWFEIEMYGDFISGMVNLLDNDIENKDNITIDLCLNLSQHLEKLNTDNITVNLSDARPSSFTSLSVISSLVIYCVLAFCMTFIRELIKDIEDMNGDYALHMNTLPILIGTKRTKYVVLLLSFFLRTDHDILFQQQG